MGTVKILFGWDEDNPQKLANELLNTSQVGNGFVLSGNAGRVAVFRCRNAE